MMQLFIVKVLVFLVGDAFVEGLGAFVAFRDEVEADASDVLLGTEALGIVDLVALDFEFHHAPLRKTHAIAFAQMTVDNLCHTHEYANDIAFAETCALGCFLDEFVALNRLVVNGYSLVLAIILERWLVFFLDSVSHNCFFSFNEFQYLLVGSVGKYGLEMGEEAFEGFIGRSRTLAGFATMQLFWGVE